MTAGRWGPYLVDGISALGVVAQEVAGEDDPGHVGSAALLPLVPQLPCHHLHHPLGAQQALAPTSTQAQTGHQGHKPVCVRVGVQASEDQAQQSRGPPPETSHCLPQS